MRKRLLSMVLTLCMLFSMLPVISFPASATVNVYVSLTKTYTNCNDASKTVSFLPVFPDGSFEDGTVKFGYKDGNEITEIVPSGFGYSMSDVKAYALAGMLYYSSSSEEPLTGIAFTPAISWSQIYEDPENGKSAYIYNDNGSIMDYLDDTKEAIRIEGLGSYDDITSSNYMPQIGGADLSDILTAYGSGGMFIWSSAYKNASIIYAYNKNAGSFAPKSKNANSCYAIFSTSFGGTSKYEITNATKEEDKNTKNGYIKTDVEAADGGDEVTVTVIPNEGYQMDTLTVQGDGSVDYSAGTTPGTYTFLMPDADVTVSCTFTLKKYAITNNTAEASKATNHGYIQINKIEEIKGGTVTVTVIPNEGYEKDTLTVSDGTNSIATTAGATPDTYTFTMPEKAVSVTATFKTATTITGVSVTGYTGQFDGENHTVTVSGTKAGDTVAYSTNGTDYNLTVAPTYSGICNNTVYVKVSRTGYNDYLASATVEITKKQLSITDTAVSDKYYDGTANATVVVGALSGKVTGFDSVGVNATGSFAQSIAGTHTVTVTYTLTGTNTDYYIAPADDEIYATINKKQINVTANNKNSLVGADIETLTYTADALVGSDGFSGALETTADKNTAGTYDITQGTLTAGDNYQITFTKGTYTVGDGACYLDKDKNGAFNGDDEKFLTVQGAINDAGTTASTIRLLSSSEENISIPANADITLDLNGYVLKAAGDDMAHNSVIFVSGESTSGAGDAGKLTVTDSGSDVHYFKVSDTGLWELQSNFAGTADYTFDSTNGLQKNSTPSDDIPATGKTIAVTGGCITGGTGDGVSPNQYGGGIYSSGGSLVLKGGNIIGNTAIQGGGVNWSYGSFRMEGGSIIGNSCGNANYACGGGVYVNRLTLEMSGGSIAYNTANNGGGIYFYNQTHFHMTGGAIVRNNGMGAQHCSDARLGGTVRITGNIKQGKAYNLSVSFEKTVTIEDTLSPESEIGIHYDTELGAPPFVIAEKYCDCFTSDVDALKVIDRVVDGNQHQTVLVSRINRQPSLGNGYTVGLDLKGLTNPTITYQWKKLNIKSLTDIPSFVVGSLENIGSVDGNTINTVYESTNYQSYANFTTFDSTKLSEGDYLVFSCNQEPLSTDYAPMPEKIGDKYYYPLYDIGGVLLVLFENQATLTNAAICNADDMAGETAAKLAAPEIGTTYRCAVTVNGVTINSDDVTIVAMPTEMETAKYYASLTLNESIDVNLSIDTLGAGFDKNLLKVYADDTEITDISYDGTRVGCILKPVAPGELSEGIHVTVMYNGVNVKDFDYTVRNYCDAVLTHPDYGEAHKLGKLCKALLNYGKLAEEYFETNPGSTVNAGYEIDWSSYSGLPTPSSSGYTNPGDITAASGSLVLESKTKLRFTLTSTGTYTAENVEIFNGSGEKVSADKIDFVKSGNDYTITIKDVYASQLGNDYTLKLKGNTILTYGVYTYCYNIQSNQNNQTLKDLCKAIHNYSQAAKAYADSLS